MLTYCILISSMVIGLGLKVRFSIWLVSGYSHTFILLTVVTVPYPSYSRSD